MVIKIKKNEVIFLFLMMLEVNFFCLIDFPQYYYAINSHFSKVITFFSTLILLAFTINKKRIYFGKYGKFIIFFWMNWVVVDVFSVVKLENTDFVGTIKDYYYYWIMLLFFYLINECRKEEKCDFIHLIVTRIAIIFSVLLVIQFYLYKYGIVFLKFNDAFLGMTENRMTAGFEIVLFSAIFLCSDLIKNTGWMRCKTILSIFIELFYLIRVVNSRSAVIVYMIMICVTMLVNSQNKYVRKIVSRIIMLCGIIAVVAFKSEIFDFFLSVRASSTRQRIREVLFYSTKVFQNGLVGIGFLRDSQMNRVALHGVEGLYYISDIGVLGFLAVWGLLGIIIIIYMLVILYKSCRNARGHIGVYRNYITGSVIYLLTTAVNLSPFDPQRIIFFAISMTLIEFSDEKILEKKVYECGSSCSDIQ